MRCGQVTTMSSASDQQWLECGADQSLRSCAVSCHDTAGIWVAFFQDCQQYRCGQDLGWMVDHQVVGAGAGIGGGGTEFVCAESKPHTSRRKPGPRFPKAAAIILRTGDAMTGQCHTDVTFLDALSICADVGARLCTLPEVRFNPILIRFNPI